MINYSGWQWLLIDVANQFGLDKLTFEDRIKWTEDNLEKLESLDSEVPKKKRALYVKARLAVRKAQKGLPTGHMVGVDGTCSGIQIMSALTGCTAGAKATNLIDPTIRYDAYTEVTEAMSKILGSSISVSRDDAKSAVMTSFYGSKAEPKKIFGEGSPQLEAFYQAATTVAPGAWELLQDLLSSWQPYTLSHNWKLPDGFDAHVKVMTKRTVRIEVDELPGHPTFSYELYDNAGEKKGLSNVANVVHSVDGFIVREMHRRCNHNYKTTSQAALDIEIELIARNIGKVHDDKCFDSNIEYYRDQYHYSGMPSAVIAPYIDTDTVSYLSTEHLVALSKVFNGMLQYRPFDLVTVHDEFRSLANNVNWVRWQYKEILAQIADSVLLDDIVSQLHQSVGTFRKLSSNLGNQIRNSNYALV